MLACQDRTLRILAGTEARYTIATSSPPTALAALSGAPHDPAGTRSAGGGGAVTELLYGTAAGTVVQLFIGSPNVAEGFTIANPSRRAPVTALFSGLDLSKTGLPDIVVGRSDGSLEVYDLDDAGVPQLVASTNVRPRARGASPSPPPGGGAFVRWRGAQGWL